MEIQSIRKWEKRSTVRSDRGSKEGGEIESRGEGIFEQKKPKKKNLKKKEPQWG